MPGTILGLKVSLLIGGWRWAGWRETLLTKILKWKACSQMIMEVWIVQCGSTEKSNRLSGRLHREGTFESYLERWVEKFTKRRDEESNNLYQSMSIRNAVFWEEIFNQENRYKMEKIWLWIFFKKRQKISITLGAYDRYLCPSNHVENAFPKLITKRFSKDKILQLFS